MWKAWLLDGARLANAPRRRALFIPPICLHRTSDGPVKAWVNTPSENLTDLGEKLGFTFMTDVDGRPTTGRVVGASATVEAADSISLVAWRLVQRLDRSTAWLPPRTAGWWRSVLAQTGTRRWSPTFSGPARRGDRITAALAAADLVVDFSAPPSVVEQVRASEHCRQALSV